MKVSVGDEKNGVRRESLLNHEKPSGGNMKRTRKKRKNGIFIFSVAILLIVFACIAISTLYQMDNILPENSSETTGLIENSSAADAVQEFQGTVKDATMNTLTVQGTDNCEYYFGTEGVEISTGKTGIVIGNSVTISYRGKLDSTVSAQDVELLSITVTDVDLNIDDSETADETSENAESDNPPVTVTQRAQEILNAMTLDEKVGQMFIARCPETDAAKKAEEYNLGGYILFGRDFSEKTKDEVVQAIQSCQSAAKIPMFIGVDEEGGTVNRISTNSNFRAVPFWSPQELYAEGGFDLIQSDTEEKCELLHGLGINLNFAPVCDVSQNSDDFMYARSFGRDAEHTADYVRLVVETMSEERMGSVLKHFPGYGNNADTHTGIAYDNRSYETFLNSDFVPFQAGIDSGANIVLVSHNIVSCMDNQSPASLSTQVHKILREALGFSGVVVTDDLAMDGVRDFAGDAEIAVQAVQAGNDLLCCTDFEIQIPAVLEAVKHGAITEERIEESVLRILELKISLGII
ncbi:MAG: glycoside hydrolase family 3 N-terminal domain-containing protein [Lachnospiraceae bacterium]|nr:glycoside hydrolase family 3 N-terminal domain-containing protein [Lachnospiraceae bacterium]